MRSVAFLSIVACAAASGQTLVTPEQLSRVTGPTHTALLKCQGLPLHPVLDFSLRFHAGYVVRVPLDQYQGRGHQWTIVVQIEPDGGRPVYFLDRLNLPDISDEAANARAEATAGGGYLLGEGHYHATLLLLDDQARACRANWDIDARLGFSDRAVKVAVAPGAVLPIAARGDDAVSSHAAQLNRLTVLLHAAPISPHNSTVHAGDAVTLLGALSSLMTLAPARSVRLVVFNLDQQKEIYRDGNFTSDRLPAVRQAIFEMQLAVIDYHQLQNPLGGLDLLTRLVGDEMRASNPSDAVVFLGPHARSTDRPPPEARIAHSGPPKFFYVEYQIARSLGYSLDHFNQWGTTIASSAAATAAGDGDGGNGHTVIPNQTVIESMDVPPSAVPPRDSIDYLVSMLKGKTLTVHTPADFARAMNQIAPPKGK